MQSVAAQLAHARQALAPVAGEAAAIEARALAAHAWGVSPEVLVRDAASLRDAAPLLQLVSRRLKHEPVSQIVGTKEFWKDTFFVTPDVLTPRADSETMVEELLRQRTDQSVGLRVLDLGTGSGCLMLSALREYPNATAVAADQSEAALAVAAQNAAALQLAARCTFVRSNWCSNVEGKFDVVLSNPPYIPTLDIAGLDVDVQGYEPHTALDGGADGLDCYRSIVSQITSHLNDGALILFEVGMGQAEDVAQLGSAHGLTLSTIACDLAGIARIVAFTYNPGDQS